MNKKKIGVFDSSSGGILALNYLIEYYPNEDYIFLADNLHSPYGEKTDLEIKQLLSYVLDFFMLQKVDLLIIACNTASIALQDIILPYQVIKINEGVVKEIKEDVSAKKVLILATNYTASSHFYQNAIKDITKEVIEVMCSDFVRIIEEVKIEENEPYIINKLIPFKNHIDTVILGCTHFDLILPIVKKVFGDIKIINSAYTCINMLNKYLNDNSSEDNGSLKIYMTNDNLHLCFLKYPYQKIEKISSYK